MAREVEASIRITAKDLTSPAFRSVARKMALLERTSAMMDQRSTAFHRTSMAVDHRAGAFMRTSSMVDAQASALSSRTAAMAATAGLAANEVGLLSARFVGPAALGAVLVGATRDAANFEDALFGIQKKSGATAEEMEKIREQIVAVTRQLPVSREEVAAAFERGAAAGIPLDRLAEFAKLSNQVADAWDMSAEDVGNVFAGFDKSLGLAMETMPAFASLINDLADSGIADESDIADFLDRAGASLRNFGLSAEEIAGYGAALLNLKMPSEVAARAMDTVTGKLLAPENLSPKARTALGKIVGDLEEFSKLAGNQKLMTFLNRLRSFSNQERASFLGAMLGEGFDDEIMRLVGGLDELMRNQEMVRQHNEKPSDSIAGVSAKKLETFNSQLQMLMNNIQNVGTAVGEKIIAPGTEILKEVNETIDRNAQIRAGEGKLDEQRGEGAADDARRILMKDFAELMPENIGAQNRYQVDEAFAAYGRGEVQHPRDALRRIEEAREWLAKHEARRKTMNEQPPGERTGGAPQSVDFPGERVEGGIGIPEQKPDLARDRLIEQYAEYQRAREAERARRNDPTFFPADAPISDTVFDGLDDKDDFIRARGERRQRERQARLTREAARLEQEIANRPALADALRVTTDAQPSYDERHAGMEVWTPERALEGVQSAAEAIEKLMARLPSNDYSATFAEVDRPRHGDSLVERRGLPFDERFTALQESGVAGDGLPLAGLVDRLKSIFDEDEARRGGEAMGRAAAGAISTEADGAGEAIGAAAAGRFTFEAESAAGQIGHVLGNTAGGALEAAAHRVAAIIAQAIAKASVTVRSTGSGGTQTKINVNTGHSSPSEAGQNGGGGF
ncbi:phage tail tape measure protein [Rhizobium sp. TRM95111]|uniref:phage tail tape measure protein n=1 Tax=Rhizobium alarense TaxID=2846851 RepID=UPI001F32B250|nr:phage tail tape measure protein [Rhizobium alarense]MCF3642916.1 phage tail tape measure protein [Rhizobium alarense]